MQVSAPPGLTRLLEPIVGAPVHLQELKHKPGRRRTLRATGARRRTIVKLYASARAPRVAARVGALAEGPAEPRVPEVLHVDEGLRMIVLSEVPGVPLGEALLNGVPGVAERAGAALGTWHQAWQSRTPKALSPHTLEREREILLRQAENAPAGLAAAARSELADALDNLNPWDAPTVVHRDLYEEQILLGDTVGLIDLDDAALGPPELDLGNLWAHLDLLALRKGRHLQDSCIRLICAYTRSGPALDSDLLQICRRLTLLRLACLHRLEKLILVGPRSPV